MVDIEVLLRRSVISMEQANDRRAKLNQSFALLSPDQAAKLLERILTFDGARLPLDFRRLHRAVRLELLVKLAQRLGTQTAAQFHARLTVAGAPTAADANLQKGLRTVFPDGMLPLRAQFLEALRGPSAAGIPRVLLEFRSHGQQMSQDNKVRERPDVPDNLGPDPDPGDGRNWMEIRGTVIGHRPGAEYKFGRIIEQGDWYLVGKNTWKCRNYSPPGTDDNKYTADEDNQPDNDHIYVIDGPGPPIPPGMFAVAGKLPAIPDDERPNVTEYVYMINAIETVGVKIGSGPWMQMAGGEMKWSSVTWLEKASGKWRRKPGTENKIVAASLDDMEIGAAAGQPPAVP